MGGGPAALVVEVVRPEVVSKPRAVLGQ